jgi:hypothetical protein
MYSTESLAAMPDQAILLIKAKAAERRSAAWRDRGPPRTLKILTAAPANSQDPDGATPIRGARLQYVFDFFLAFFFFAMTLFLGVGENFGRAGSSRGRSLLICPWPSPQSEQWHTASFDRNQKRKIVPVA